jgi:hypothetical protein
MSMKPIGGDVAAAMEPVAANAAANKVNEQTQTQKNTQGAVGELVKSAMEGSGKQPGNVLREANPDAPAGASNTNKGQGSADTSGVSDTKTSKGNSSKMERLLEIIQMLVDVLKGESKAKGADSGDKPEAGAGDGKAQGKGADAPTKGGGSPSDGKADGKQGAGKPEGNQGAGKADGPQAAAKPDDAQDAEETDEDKQILDILKMLTELLSGKKKHKADHKKPEAGGKDDKSLGDGKLTGSDFDKVMESCLKNIMEGLKKGKVNPDDMKMLSQLGDMKEKLGLGNKSDGNSANNAGGEPSQGQSALEGGGKVAGILQKLEATMKQISSQRGANGMSGGQEEEDEQAV